MKQHKNDIIMPNSWDIRKEHFTMNRKNCINIKDGILDAYCIYTEINLKFIFLNLSSLIWQF